MKKPLHHEIIRLIRPYQWIKNLLLFSPIFFAGKVMETTLLTVSAGVVIFCLISSLGYLLNDWMDREKDVYHFSKKTRPFAAQTISGRQGIMIALTLFTVTGILITIYPLPLQFIVYLALYTVLTCCYSLYVKNVMILEIFFVALGFVFRVLAGGAAGGVKISSWLFLTVFFIAMMISIAKRVNELKELGEETAVLHRNSQAGYSGIYLNSMLWACGSITLVVYALYAVEHEALVVYSVVPATYGIFRFIYLTDLGRGSDPIRTMFSDRQLLLTTLIFICFLTIVIYY